ncbi:hypothetical protein B0H11DRAFT_2286726 [Mycena galericulata]|nr:hypothetical protein B0H11DRAFT_272044 [Mycena galericulata]KAJ7457933.1 hypothetical protein B0H11DRAFT_2286726 [Mycena galericulata]
MSPALLVLLDRPPSLKLERKLSGNRALRTGINKTTTLAPIIEEPEPVEDTAQLPTVLQDICNTPGHTLAISAVTCPKPLHLEFLRAATRKPFPPSSLNTKQTTPTVEFTSLCLGEAPEPSLTPLKPSSNAKSIQSSPVPRQLDGNVLIPGPRRRFSAADGVPGSEEISIRRISQGVAKRERDPEDDEESERQDAKRARKGLTDAYPARRRRRDTRSSCQDSPGRRDLDTDLSRLRASLPARSVPASERVPHPIHTRRKRSFRDIELNEDESGEDASRYAKRPARAR